MRRETKGRKEDPQKIADLRPNKGNKGNHGLGQLQKRAYLEFQDQTIPPPKAHGRHLIGERGGKKRVEAKRGKNISIDIYSVASLSMETETMISCLG